MNVLMISLDSEVFNLNSKVARRLREYGKQVKTLSILIPSKRADSLFLSKNVCVYGSGGRFKITQLINLYFKFKYICKKDNCNIVTVQDIYYIALISLFLSYKFKLPLEIQVHGFEKLYGIRKLIGHFVIKRSDKVRVVSRRLFELLSHEYKVEKDKIYILPITFIENEVDNISLPDKNSKFIFLSVCRLVKVKRIDFLIRAFFKINKEYPNANLWIVGSGPCEKRLKLLTKKLGVEKEIKFWGWQSDISRFYKQADVFVLTSESEGWGMVVIEAGYFGLPTVMTDVGLAGDLVINNQNGLIVPVGDEESLIKNMVKIMEDEDLRLKLSREIKSTISNLPTLEEEVRVCVENWKEMINI